MITKVLLSVLILYLQSYNINGLTCHCEGNHCAEETCTIPDGLCYNHIETASDGSVTTSKGCYTKEELYNPPYHCRNNRRNSITECCRYNRCNGLDLRSRAWRTRPSRPTVSPKEGGTPTNTDSGDPAEQQNSDSVSTKPACGLQIKDLQTQISKLQSKLANLNTRRRIWLGAFRRARKEARDGAQEK